jgi:hypothetical protein
MGITFQHRDEWNDTNETIRINETNETKPIKNRQYICVLDTIYPNQTHFEKGGGNCPLEIQKIFPNSIRLVLFDRSIRPVSFVSFTTLRFVPFVPMPTFQGHRIFECSLLHFYASCCEGTRTLVTTRIHDRSLRPLVTGLSLQNPINFNFKNSIFS